MTTRAEAMGRITAQLNALEDRRTAQSIVDGARRLRGEIKKLADLLELLPLLETGEELAGELVYVAERIDALTNVAELARDEILVAFFDSFGWPDSPPAGAPDGEYAARAYPELTDGPPLSTQLDGLVAGGDPLEPSGPLERLEEWKGRRLAPEERWCSRCRATGNDPLGSDGIRRLPCSLCGGTGVVAKPAAAL